MQNNAQWKEELKILSNIISQFPFQSCIKWGAEVFTFNGKNVVSYGGFKNYFALWFFNGVFLKDTHNVLVNAQEGKTKSLRQWRFTSKEEINSKLIQQYLKEAIAIEKKGLRIHPEKFKSLPVPDLLLNALNSNKRLKTGFAKLTPGKQKEYILYLNEAKQEATRLTRLEKIKPLVLLGIGLNDKYK